MSSITFSRVAVLATAVLGASTSLAQGQFSGNGCDTCTPIQPVLQSCYQTVPVTEYQPVTQTVRRPVYRTEYVEQPVTVYRPVTERRTQQVPTVRYQNVTQYRTVQRDMGRWVTQYRPNPRLQPGQIDNRPGVIGWVNRANYRLRNAFTPKYTAIRQYQPRMMACTVPQTRQVAVRGTRTVAQNVTRMVATQTVQRRPVQRLSYVDQEVTVMRPRTTYRTVPIGTAVAYAPQYGTGSSVAYAPYGGSSVAYTPSSGSSVAYDSLSSGTIQNARVIDDRPLRSATLEPEPDNSLPRAAENPIRRNPVETGQLDKEGYRRPINRTAARDASVTPDASRYGRDSRGTTPTRRLSNPGTQPPAATANPYERSRPSTPAAAPQEPDPFGGDMFDSKPSASTVPPTRYLRTSLNSGDSPPSSGWRASRSVRVLQVPKIKPPRISVANR
jgi:hypothetical protein